MNNVITQNLTIKVHTIQSGTNPVEMTGMLVARVCDVAKIGHASFITENDGGGVTAREVATTVLTHEQILTLHEQDMINVWDCMYNNMNFRDMAHAIEEFDY